jgi:hypothetical protein
MGNADSLVTAEIVITRFIDENGRMAVKFKTPATYNSVEILGLLEACKCHIFMEMIAK